MKRMEENRMVKRVVEGELTGVRRVSKLRKRERKFMGYKGMPVYQAEEIVYDRVHGGVL